MIKDMRYVLTAALILTLLSFGGAKADDICPPLVAPKGYDFYLPCTPYNPSNPDLGPQIYFEQHSTELSPDARKLIRHQAEVLRNHPGVTIDLVGFADIDEAPRALEKAALGGNRAAAVRTYLIELGIEAARLNASGREYAAVIPRVLNDRVLASMRFVYVKPRDE